MTSRLTIGGRDAQTSHRHRPHDPGPAPGAASCQAAPAQPHPARAHSTTAKALGAAVAALIDLQDEYRAWLENLPASLAESTLAEKLQAIAELDLEELQMIDPPRGYGRD